MQQTSSQAYLIIQLANRWTDVLRMQAGESVVIGRASNNQIVVRDERVSRKHAQIDFQEGNWIVQDLGSRNGTQVDEVPIAAPHHLQEGETVTVGGCDITFAHSLTRGFAASRQLSRRSGESLGGQQTAELLPEPTIVNRRSYSQWSADAIPGPESLPISHLVGESKTSGPKTARAASSNQWNFFYRLVFDLVASPSPEATAQVALDRILDQLGVACGGVVMTDSLKATNAAQVSSEFDPQATVTGKQNDFAIPPLLVLAARQHPGGSYQRASDFLVATAVQDRQAVLARNVMNDSKLSVTRQSQQQEIVSVICAPLRVREVESVRKADSAPNDSKNKKQPGASATEKIIGLLHVYSSGEERILNEQDLDLVVGVADNLAIALAQKQAQQTLSQSLEKSHRAIDQLRQQLLVNSEMVGSSQAIDRVRREISRAAPTNATVLVRGESGVGKELVARAIHENSHRREGPLICLNCAALAPTLLESELFGHEKGSFTGATDRKIGKFEAADGGTLLLDEIGEMPSELQAKFLRVLEGQTFERLGGNKPIKTDVRVIAATNRDLEQAVKAKEFRADLYFRLRVIEIAVPPLRERLDDVPALVDCFLDQLRIHAGRRLNGVEPAALHVLSTHTWPGNIRELRNVIERAVVLGSGSNIRVEDLNLSTLGTGLDQPLVRQANLPHETNHEPPFVPITLAELEQTHIAAALKHCGGNKTKTAQLLGIERSTLDRKLKRYEQ